ncbi:MAG: hypothetical protein ABUR63_01740 [Verrucomicrobiota bacterium]
MFGIIARTTQYAAFFAKLTAHHAVVDEFDPSTNCARTIVVETGFPGNSECVDATWIPRPIDQSDVIFEEQAPPPPPTTESEMPDLARKGKI